MIFALMMALVAEFLKFVFTALLLTAFIFPNAFTIF